MLTNLPVPDGEVGLDVAGSLGLGAGGGVHGDQGVLVRAVVRELIRGKDLLEGAPRHLLIGRLQT